MEKVDSLLILEEEKHTPIPLEEEKHTPIPLEEEKHSPIPLDETLLLTSEDYDFIDKIIAYENEGIQIECYNDFYVKSLIILKKLLSTKPPDNNEEDTAISSIGYLLFAIYYWTEDYINRTTVFMSKNCLKIHGKSRLKFLQDWQPYLRVIVLVQKMYEFNSKEAFYEEWVSYSQHKKMLFISLVDLCVRNKIEGGFPLMTTEHNDKIIASYLKSVYIDIPEFKLSLSIGYHQYAMQLVFDALVKPVKPDKPDKKEVIIAKKKSTTTTRKNNDKAKNSTTEVVNAKEKTKAPPSSSAAEHFDIEEDTTGFTMVQITVIRIKYLLKTQDYDLIRRSITHIFQPICGVGCTVRFRDGQSGKYVGIIFAGVEVAHISYYHHSQHLYHFKIDVPSHFRLPALTPSKNYTVPFNFHMTATTGEITFTIRPIDNPRTEVQCPDMIAKVSECLRLHVVELNSVVRIGRGVHKSRRRRQGKKRTRKRRFHK
jgi:hypothetical protein